MNKLIKGAVTGAAGIALLLGGAGTFAAWNTDASIAKDTTISDGHLSVDVDKTVKPEWDDVTYGGTTSIDPSQFVFVPGDHLRLKEDVTISAQGSNLTAQLSATTPGATDAAGFQVTAAFDTSGTAGQIVSLGDGTYSFKTQGAAAVTLTVPVTVDITLPANAAATAMDEKYDLNNVTINLEQQLPDSKS